MAPSVWQILIVVILVFLLFGAGKMPRVMGDLAQGIKSFKKGLKDEDDGGADVAAKEISKDAEKTDA